MAELANYEVTQNGTPTTMQLTEADAERLGAKRIGPAHDVQSADDEADDAAANKAAPDATRDVQTRARRAR